MRTLGIIAGLSPESSSAYYLQLTHLAQKHFNNHTGMPIVMWSVDTEYVIRAAQAHDWHAIAELLISVAKRLIAAGAEAIVIPFNRLHKVADIVQAAINVPLINILQCVAEEINQKHYQKVALLGTQFTTEQKFYSQYLVRHTQASVIVPSMSHRQKLNEIIFNELCYGNVTSSSKKYLNMLCRMLYLEHHCDAMILGCTELPLICNADELQIPLVNTAALHVQQAFYFALQKENMCLPDLEVAI